MPEFVHQQGRPRRSDMLRARKGNLQAEYEHTARQAAVKDQLAQALARIRERTGSHSEMPEEFTSMMEALMETALPPFHPPHAALDLQTATHDFIRARAEQMPGIYIAGDWRGGEPRDPVSIFDFTQMISGATHIEYFPKGDPDDEESDKPYVEIFRGEAGADCLNGATAEAFLRYLHYSGLFLVENAKHPCPDCSDGPPRDCETCGGLGWIIPDDEPAGPPVPEKFGDPELRAAVERASAAGQFNVQMVASDDPHVNTTINLLLDSNLKALATLQAIQRWCNSGPETNAGEALHAIERLVREALTPPVPTEPAPDAHP